MESKTAKKIKEKSNVVDSSTILFFACCEAANNSQNALFDLVMKIFLKAFLTPNYSNSEGKRTPKKRNFWSKFSEKCLKPFFWLVF